MFWFLVLYVFEAMNKPSKATMNLTKLREKKSSFSEKKQVKDEVYEALLPIIL